MSIIDRGALEASPLADLHAMASELSIDGYRRLRRPELVDAILARQEGTETESGDDPDQQPEALLDADEQPEGVADADEHPEGVADADEQPEGVADADEQPEALPDAEELAEAVADDLKDDDDDAGSRRRRRGRRGGRGRGSRVDDRDDADRDSDADHADDDKDEPAGEETVEGVVELVANGSGFVRVNPPEESDDDVYVSAAQVKRCELLSGDRVSGPRRPPRRSERFASLVRVDTINGEPASEIADSARFDDVPAAFASERLPLGSDDPTITAIEMVAPIGKGSRVTITGASRAGKTEALRRLASALSGHDDLHLLLVLVGVRPEEITEWDAGPVKPAAAVSFAASADAQTQALEPVVDQARRWAARGSHAVVLIDTLDGLHPAAARKALASARRIVDGGTLTVIATASEPIGGETSVIALDVRLAGAGSFPALDVGASATMRPELLVGDEGAEAIARTRAQALDPAPPTTRARKR